MNLIELQRALKQLRLSGIAAVLETPLHQCTNRRNGAIDLISRLVAETSSAAQQTGRLPRPAPNGGQLRLQPEDKS